MLENIQPQIQWLVIPGSYLIGSVSWGLIIGKLARGIDVRQHGSGSTGSTNVLRTLGPRLGALVFLLDVSKGVLAIIAAKLIGDEPLIDGLAALAVIAGISYVLASDEVLLKYEKYGVDELTSRNVGMGIIATYILGILSFGLILYFGIVRIFKS